MKVDCQWFTNNLEAISNETLGDDEKRLALEHRAGCAACRTEMESIEGVDPLIHAVFQYRLAESQSKPRPSAQRFGWRIALAGAAVAIVALLSVTIFLRESPATAPLPVAAAPANQNPVLPSTANIKSADSGIVTRAKSNDAPEVLQNVAPSAVAPIPADAPEFAVIDPAGYATTLDDYRGHLLLLGVWSPDRPESATNLERIYQIFGANPRIRILGISRQKQERLAGTTFPLVFNNGSKLLGARNAGFLLVDTAGKVQLRGSLDDGEALIPRIQAKLDQLGIR